MSKSKRMITSLLLCALASGAAPRDALGGVFAAPSAESGSNYRHGWALERLRDGDDETALDSMPALHEGIDDSSLEGDEDYQKWKRAFLRTQAGRALWSKYSRFRLNIRMGENSGGRCGVEATDYVFAGGRLVGATIVLGVEFARSAPANTAAYPILSSLTDNSNNIGREARAVAFLSHEFGHIENARRIGGTAQRQNRLLDQNETGFINYGRAWFSRPEYRQVVSELGATPTEIMQERETGAEGSVIPVIQEYFGKRMPAVVRQAIQNYQKAHPLSVAVADTQRTLASDLDAELPRLPFADWFKQIVGPGAGITWQLSECADRREEAPNDLRACAEASAILRDGRLVILRVVVGTFKRGRIGSPTFSFGVVEQDGELYPVRRLRDLPGQLSPWRSAKKSAVELPAVRIPKIKLIATNIPLVLLETSTIEEPSPPPPPEAASIGENLGATKALESTSWELEASPSAIVTGASEGLKMSGSVSWGDVVNKVRPRYPAKAKRVNASGQVEVQITVSAEGRVTEAKAISGHPLLLEAAEEAARQWVFKPATLDGVPVETQRVLTFLFRASQ